MHPAGLLTCAQGAHLSFASFAESMFAADPRRILFAFRLLGSSFSLLPVRLAVPLSWCWSDLKICSRAASPRVGSAMAFDAEALQPLQLSLEE